MHAIRLKSWPRQRRIKTLGADKTRRVQLARNNRPPQRRPLPRTNTMVDTPATSPTPSSSTQRKPLPPGMILGPDGKPCKICNVWRNMPRQASKAGATAGSAQSNTISKTAAALGAIAASPTNTLPTRSENCPPDVEQLGRATWTFLHTTAAYYPERPTPTQRANMLSLLRSLPLLYPCSHCASHLGDELKDHPPDVSGRFGLSRWLCERHNEVNGRLGKQRFDCAISKLDERWKDGPSDGSCD